MVILQNEECGQIPNRGEVEVLVERSAIGRAVAEKTDRDLIGAAQFRRERGAGDQAEAARDDAIGAEHAHREIGDVHRAALAFA